MTKNVFRKSLVIGIICLFVGASITTISSKTIENINLTPYNNMKQSDYHILITELEGDRVIEIDFSGSIIWEKTGLNGPLDAERLDNGNTLITEFYGNRVIEVDFSGSVVWEKTGLNGPSDAERLDNGNTLIAENVENRVIEVDSSGSVVWQKTGLTNPIDAERLDNGNTLITEIFGNRVIEVDSGGSVVWEKTGLTGPVDAERLDNGNTLITEMDAFHVIEVDSGGIIVWEKITHPRPYDAERLDNGNTLIAVVYWNGVIEVDSNGNTVWEKTGLNFPVDAERIIAGNQPPNTPTITGETNGNAGTEYEYTFNAIDPDGDNVKYHIDWDDGDSETTDFNLSGTDVKVKHTWDERGTYTIKAKAEDTNGLIGPKGTLTVTMPRNRIVNRSFLNFLENHPNMFPILQLLLQRLGL